MQPINNLNEKRLNKKQKLKKKKSVAAPCILIALKNIFFGIFNKVPSYT